MTAESPHGQICIEPMTRAAFRAKWGCEPEVDRVFSIEEIEAMGEKAVDLFSVALTEVLLRKSGALN